MSAGIILYGPPGSGKDTITGELLRLDNRYAHFARLKAGPGRTAGYRITTEEHLDELRRAGRIIWENHRYRATYAIDAPALDEALATSWPVLHLGQPEAVRRLAELRPATWLTVELWCPRDIAQHRLLARGAHDTPARLTAWDQTPHLDGAHLLIDTSTAAPRSAAGRIHDRFTRHASG